MIALEGDLVVLKGSPWIDVRAFADAAAAAREAGRLDLYEQALDLWRGELLPADAYEAWAEPHRERLGRLHRDLMLELANLYTARGDHAAGEARLHEALQHDPLDEDGHRRLMRLYADAGRLEHALRQYERLRAVLAKELAIAPADETESLVLAIKRARAIEPPPPCPEIAYANTSDGVRIAYWSLGDGPPLIIMPTPPLSHIARQWQIPEIRRWYTGLARGRTIVRYDARNTGSSTRGVKQVSVAGQMLDLDAVLTALRLTTADLYASMTAVPPALLFAAARPSTVRRLILEHGHARGSELFNDAATRLAASAIEQDWFIYCDLLARAECGWADERCTPALKEMFLDASTPEDARAHLPFAAAADATQALEVITAPTLVLHRPRTNAVPLALSEGIAAGIKNARLVLLEGMASAPYIGDTDAVIAEVQAFLA